MIIMTDERRSMEKCNKKLAFFLVFGNMSSLSVKHYDKTSFNSALIQRKYYSWLFYFTSLQKQQKQKVTKEVVKKNINQFHGKNGRPGRRTGTGRVQK